MWDTYSDKSSKSSIPFTFIPLKLGFACATHGVQSLTLDRFLIFFDRREYFLNQAYVCLTRARSLCSFLILDEELPLTRFTTGLVKKYLKFKSDLERIGIYEESDLDDKFRRSL
jgi:hypothetical protein